jgi:hypothetical protein
MWVICVGRYSRSWGTPRGQLVFIRMKRRYPILVGCCTWYTLYIVYAVLGVCRTWWMLYLVWTVLSVYWTWCILYSVYAVLSLISAGSQHMMMQLWDGEQWLISAICDYGRIRDEKQRDTRCSWKQCGGYVQQWEIRGLPCLIGWGRLHMNVIRAGLGFVTVKAYARVCPRRKESQ